MEEEDKAVPTPAVADGRTVGSLSWDRYMALAEEALNGARSSVHRETSTCLVREAEGWVSLANAITTREVAEAHRAHALAAEDAAETGRQILDVNREALELARTQNHGGAER